MAIGYSSAGSAREVPGGGLAGGGSSRGRGFGLPHWSGPPAIGEGGEQLVEWEENNANASGFAETPTGAFVMGRNMFGPGRGEWDTSWTGWDEEPSYQAPVYVLTHHSRRPVTVTGGTTFHFVTDGIEKAMKMAREAAGNLDVQIVGGARTTQQYLAADLLDELVLHIAPITLGAGERLLDGVAPSSSSSSK